MSPRRSTLATLASLALAAASCGGSDADGRLSTVLITLDTTRADALSCYGGPAGATPNLDALASEGVVFETAYTTVPITLPAHASMLTGLYPPRHGVRDNGIVPLPESATTLAELARGAGFETAAFVASVVMDSPFGLDQGFEVYDVPVRPPLDAPRAERGAERSADAIVDAALAWLETRDGERPFFAWLHFYDPHLPYQPPADLAPASEDLRELYQAEVLGMDREIGRFVDALREKGALARTVVLVVGDHGEGLGEHGEVTHGAHCYEPTLRVPWILRHADGHRAGERDTGVVGVSDVHPTLAEAMGLEPAPGIDGTSLYRRSAPSDRGVYFESHYGFFSYGWSPLAGWVDAHGKYLASSEPQLFDPRSDPGESLDLFDTRADDALRYQRAIAEVLARPALPRDAAEAIDEDLTRQIQDLGYAVLGEAEEELPSPLEPSDLPSPQSRTGLHELQLQAKYHFRTGEFEEAAAINEGILAENPRNFVALEDLAACRARQGRVGDAIDILQRRLRIGAPRGKTWFTLGLLYRQAERLDEAIEAFGVAVELTNGRPRYVRTLADVLEAEGRGDEARELLARHGLGGSRG